MHGHEQSFPDSTEPADRRTARAEAALEYEERARIGFRRRTAENLGDPWTTPETYQVDREPTTWELSGGFFAAIATVLGVAAIFYAPLPFSFLAVVLALLALSTGYRAAHAARRALVIASFGFVVGMLIAIAFERPILF